MGPKVGGHLTDGAELITVAGVNCRRSAEVVPQDGTKDQRPRPLRTSISTSVTHERVREEISPNAPNERFGYNIPDPPIAEGQPGFSNGGGREGQGTVAGQPPAPTENTFDVDRVGEGAHDTVKSEFPDGERWLAGSIPVCIYLFQLQKGAGKAGQFEIPPHVLIRKRHVDSVLSNLSYPPFTLIAGYACDLPCRIVLLTNTLTGNYHPPEQGRRPSVAFRRVRETV